MSNDFVRKGYDKVAENYFKGRDKFKSDKYLNKLNDLLDSNSIILDIGCGAGVPVDQYFTEKGHKIIGIDISIRQIELAKKNVPMADYKVQDMSLLKVGEYSVDAVVSFYSIFHTPRESHQEILNKFNSFLKKDGLMLVTMGSSDWEGQENNFFGGEMYWSHYGSAENRKIVENAGFKILLDEIDTTGGESHQVLLARKK